MTFVLAHMLGMGLGGAQGSAEPSSYWLLYNPMRVGKRGR